MKYETIYIHTYKVLYSIVLGFFVLYKSTYFNTAYAPAAMLSLSLFFSVSLFSCVRTAGACSPSSRSPPTAIAHEEWRRKKVKRIEGRWPIQDMAEVVVERSAVACACDEAEQALRYKRDRSWVALFFGDFLCGFLFSFCLLPSQPNHPATPPFFPSMFPPKWSVSFLKSSACEDIFSP